MTSADVLIYVQHLLGIGHVRRISAIARAASAAGLRVTLVSGGPPVPGIAEGVDTFIQLPPVHARDADFALLDAEGRPVDEALRVARRTRLLEALAETRPKGILIELFPFGRRQMRFELVPFIEAARAHRPRPLVLSSLRDILNPIRKPEKLAWSLEIFARYFDLALVHSDPAVCPLEASLPEAKRFAGRLHYTGYVVNPKPPPATEGKGEILVSAGGGAVAGPLVEAALGARELSSLGGRPPWRILIGHNLPEEAFRGYARHASSGLVIERARSDFLSRLACARLSISQAGYNTVMEVLRAGVPSVVVPFAEGGEREQTLRAELFERRGWLTSVPSPRLSSSVLAQAIDSAPVPRVPPTLDMAGAERSAEILVKVLGRGVS